MQRSTLDSKQIKTNWAWNFPLRVQTWILLYFPVAVISRYTVFTLKRNFLFKVCLNRYSWSAGQVGSEYSSWFIRLECISWRFLTMSRLSKCLYHIRSCRNSSEYSKTLGNFLPLLIIRLAQTIVWDIFTTVSSDAALPIFNLGLWCFSSGDILI